MKKGKRPSSHVRRVKTKKGHKKVRVNPQIKKRVRVSRSSRLRPGLFKMDVIDDNRTEGLIYDEDQSAFINPQTTKRRRQIPTAIGDLNSTNVGLAFKQEKKLLRKKTIKKRVPSPGQRRTRGQNISEKRVA
ncbi:hypothetical protein GOV10_03475, partial [Candidatus Woesearchaeota archaeon]|nr:hypothetical protein [Candidatus Woesearchaeota archaeon]